MTNKNEKINLSMIALSLIIVVSVLISPAINNKIFAKSYELPAKIKPSGAGEVSEFYERVNAYYDSIKDLSIYKANEAFNRKNITTTPSSLGNPSEDRPQFLSKRNDLEKEGSIYAPRGEELMHEGAGSMSSGSMYLRPEITCLGHGIMLSGSRGQTGHIDENHTMSPELLRAIEESLVSNNNELATVGRNVYATIATNLIYNEAMKNNNPNIRWVKTENEVQGEVVGVDPVREPEKEAALNSEITQTLKDAYEKSKREVAEVIRQVETGRLDLNRDFSSSQQSGELPSDNALRSTNRYKLREHRIGARLVPNPDRMGPSDTISPEAGYIINEMYIKRFDDPEFYENPEVNENKAGGEVQQGIWAGTEEGQRGEAWYHSGKPVSEDSISPKAYSIVQDSKEFKKYWEEMVEYCNDRKENKYPNQKVIHSTQRGKKVKFTGEVPENLPKEVVITNPGIKYEPRFVEVNGSKPEDRKQMIFDQEKQVYKIGPYKLDYMNYFKKDQGNGRGWFAALTNAKIYGKYDNNENGQNEWKNEETYKKYEEAKKAYEKAIEADKKAKNDFSEKIKELKKELANFAHEIRRKTPKAIEEFNELKKIYNELIDKYNKFIGQTKVEEMKKTTDEIKELKKRFEDLKNKNLEEENKKMIETLEEAFNLLDKAVDTQIKEAEAKKAYEEAKKTWEEKRRELVKEKNKKERDEENEKERQRRNTDGRDVEGVKFEDLGEYKIKFHKERSKERNKPENPWRTVAVGPGSNLKAGQIIVIDAFKDKNNEAYVVVTDDGKNPSLNGKELSISVSSEEEAKKMGEKTAKVKVLKSSDTSQISGKPSNLLATGSSASAENGTLGNKKELKVDSYYTWSTRRDNINNIGGRPNISMEQYNVYVINTIRDWVKTNNTLDDYNKAIDFTINTLHPTVLKRKNKNEKTESEKLLEELETQKEKLEEKNKEKEKKEKKSQGGQSSQTQNSQQRNQEQSQTNPDPNPNQEQNQSQTQQGEPVGTITPQTMDPLENDEDASINITDPEIKGWKFLIKGVKPEDREYYVPLPGEEFYFVVPYDQNLRGISAIKLEFYHMVYGGEAKLYEGSNTIFSDLQDQARLDAQITDNGLTLKVDNVAYSIKANSTTDSPSQPLGYWASAKWFEKTILVLKADDEDIPQPDPDPDPDPNPNPDNPEEPIEPSLVRFLMPIGGMVWEDKLVGEKHLEKDNIYTEGEDELLKGIKVNVYRVIGEKEGENGIKNILEKQEARLFKKDSRTPVEWDNIYTNEEGKWGPFDLHDVGFSETEKQKYSPDTHRVVFEVEYLYDGIQYEPVIPLASMSGDNLKEKVNGFIKMQTEEKEKQFISSFAIENREIRRKYNLTNAEIAGVTEINNEGKTDGASVATDDNNVRTGDVHDLHYLKDEEASSFGRTVSKYQKMMPEDHKEAIQTGRFMYASTLNACIPYMFGKIDLSGTEDTSVPRLDNPTQNEDIKVSEPYMTNINFGLTERPKASSSLTKDLVSAKVIVNRKALNYIFDDAYTELLEGPKEGETKEDFVKRLFTVQVNNDPAGANLQYKLDVYKTDYIFRTEIYKNDTAENSNDPNGIFSAIEKDIVEERGLDDPGMEAYTEDTRKLDVYLTYRISLFNDAYMNSNYDTYYTEIVDYYKDDMVPVIDKEIEKVVEIDPLNANNGQTEDIGPASTDTNSAKEKNNLVKIATPKFKIYNSWQDEVKKDENNMVDFTDDFKDFKWEKINDQKEGYHILRSYDDKPELIVPAGGRADIYTNYRIKREGLDSRVGLNNSINLGKMYNIAEISSFACYDKNTGEAAGIVDDFSAPDNINLSKTLEVQDPLVDKSMFEADTDGAPIINIDIPEEEPKVRTMSGILWEDFRNEENGSIRTGNGIKEQDELPIPDQKVILEERVSIRKDLYGKKEIVNEDETKMPLNPDNTSDYVDIPFVWPEVIETSDGKINLKELTGLSTVIKTDSNGHYEFSGIPAGNFVVKTRYSASGEVEDLVKTVKTAKDTGKRLPNYYNGIDFKSTLFYGGENDKVNTTWLGKIIDGEKAKYSYLRDDEFRRLEITDLFKTWATTQSELMAIFDKDLSNATDVQKELLKRAHEYSHMVAVTPKINYSIEFYEKYTEGGNKLPNLLNMNDKAYAIKGVTVKNESNIKEIEKYNVENINLSIVERPQTKLVLNKEIQNIEYITNNGNKSFSADFKTNITVSRKEQELDKYIQEPANISFKTVIDRDSTDNMRLEETLSFENTLYELDGLNMDNAKFAQKFAYLNIDEQLLQGSKINIEYKISVYNLSENDRKIDLNGAKDLDLRGIMYYTGKEAPEASNLGQLKHEYADNEDYRFGKYIGDEYYTKVNKDLEKDDIAKAKINGIIDIMSTTMEHNKNHKTANEWMQMSRNSLIGVLQRVTEENAGQIELIDKRNGRNVPYISNEGSNILGRFEQNEKEVLPIDSFIKPGEKQNLELTKKDQEKLPEWIRTFEIGGTATTATLGLPGDFMYENSAEIVQYTMDTARRAVGNAPGSIFTDLEKEETTLFESTAKQYDADTPEYITVTPPTGLNKEMKDSRLALILIGTFSAIVAVVGFTVGIVLKRKDTKEKYFANKPWERN